MLVLDGRVERGDFDSLCLQAQSLLVSSGAEVLCCDVSRLYPDLAAVEVLARIALVAIRLGCRICVTPVVVELQELIEFIGLQDCLPALEGPASKLASEGRTGWEQR